MVCFRQSQNLSSIGKSRSFQTTLQRYIKFVDKEDCFLPKNPRSLCLLSISPCHPALERWNNLVSCRRYLLREGGESLLLSLQKQKSTNCLVLCDSDRIQTCNLLIRSQMLYSVELRSHCFSQLRCKDRHFFGMWQIVSLFFLRIFMCRLHLVEVDKGGVFPLWSIVFRKMLNSKYL